MKINKINIDIRVQGIKLVKIYYYVTNFTLLFKSKDFILHSVSDFWI